jgi:uncharacterized membrane protein (UPF0127 family)
MSHWGKRVMTLAFASSVWSCHDAPQDADDTSVLPFDVARVRLVTPTDTTYLRVELATSSEQQSLGLMERHQLADTAGMLFLYPVDQPATAGFWMFRTRIPLDIAFLDSLGQIVAIKQMVPCTATLAEGCPSYPPSVPYRAALEVNAGYFARHRLTLGSRLILSDTATAKSSHARP